MYTYMKIYEYSPDSVIIRFKYNKQFVKQLKSMNGKFNSKLKGSGWIFSKKDEDKLKKFIEEKNKDNKT